MKSIMNFEDEKYTIVATTTHHSIERGKERFGMNEKSISHLVRNAFERGKTFEDYKKNRERNWLLKREMDGCTAVVYDRKCFIISSGISCITLYDLPNWFDQYDTHYNGKEKIRDYVKYLRFHEETKYRNERQWHAQCDYMN